MKSVAAYFTPELLSAYKSVLGYLFRVDPGAISILVPDAPPPPSVVRRRRALLEVSSTHLHAAGITYSMYVTVVVSSWDQVAYITGLIDSTGIQSMLDEQYSAYATPTAYIQYSSIRIIDLTPAPTPAPPPPSSGDGSISPSGPSFSASPHAASPCLPLVAALVFAVLQVFN